MSRQTVLQAQLRLSDFPFDPSARIEELRDLEKLRAIQDQTMRGLLWELYWHVEANESDDNFWRRENAKTKRRQAQELLDLHALADRAQKGEFGFPAKQLANTMLGEHNESRTPAALEEFRRELRKLPRR